MKKSVGDILFEEIDLASQITKKISLTISCDILKDMWLLPFSSSPLLLASTSKSMFRYGLPSLGGTTYTSDYHTYIYALVLEFYEWSLPKDGYPSLLEHEPKIDEDIWFAHLRTSLPEISSNEKTLITLAIITLLKNERWMQFWRSRKKCQMRGSLPLFIGRPRS